MLTISELDFGVPSGSPGLVSSRWEILRKFTLTRTFTQVSIFCQVPILRLSWVRGWQTPRYQNRISARRELLGSQATGRKPGRKPRSHPYLAQVLSPRLFHSSFCSQHSQPYLHSPAWPRTLLWPWYLPREEASVTQGRGSPYGNPTPSERLVLQAPGHVIVWTDSLPSDVSTRQGLEMDSEPLKNPNGRRSESQRESSM